MAKLVGSFAAGHAPNVARLWEGMKAESREWLTKHYDEMGRRIKALEPDVLIIHSTDHWVNFFLDNIKINGTNVSLIPPVSSENKKLIKIVDVLGRVVEKSRNTLLFYIYDDGSVEEKIFVE